MSLTKLLCNSGKTVILLWVRSAVINAKGAPLNSHPRREASHRLPWRESFGGLRKQSALPVELPILQVHPKEHLRVLQAYHLARRLHWHSCTIRNTVKSTMYIPEEDLSLTLRRPPPFSSCKRHN
eukprot:6475405-Amphidinium_carterae.1